MLRKIGTILLSGVILVSLSACDKKDNSNTKDNNDDFAVHVFCNNDCEDLLDYLDTVDKDLKVKKHNVFREKEKTLMEQVGDYFGYAVEELVTPFTVINTKSIIGFDDTTKEEIKKAIKNEAKKEYKNIVEKLKKGENITDEPEQQPSDDKKPADDNQPSDDKKPADEQKPATDNKTPETTNETYTVKKGDYLCKIAAMYNTTWNKIYNDNRAVIGDNPNLIKPGQVLKISHASSVKYVVQKGDYLCKIAAMYNTSWNRIYEDNKAIIGNNPNLIKPGQELTINN